MLSPPCGLGPRQGLAFFSWVSGNSLESWDTARSGWRLSCTQSANPNPPRLGPVLPASDWRMIHGWDTICALEEAGKPGKQTALHGEAWDRPVPASRHGAVTISEGQTDKSADPQTDHVLASMEDGHAGRPVCRQRPVDTDRQALAGAQARRQPARHAVCFPGSPRAARTPSWSWLQPQGHAQRLDPAGVTEQRGKERLLGPKPEQGGSRSLLPQGRFSSWPQTRAPGESAHSFRLRAVPGREPAAWVERGCPAASGHLPPGLPFPLSAAGGWLLS